MKFGEEALRAGSPAARYIVHSEDSSGQRGFGARSGLPANHRRVILVRMEGNCRREWLTAIVIVALLLLVPPGLYLGGYFWLADYSQGYWVPDRTPVVTRTYPTSWLEQMYKPAGRIEQRWMGYDVEIDNRNNRW
jgi:hypothetical protein